MLFGFCIIGSYWSCKESSTVRKPTLETVVSKIESLKSEINQLEQIQNKLIEEAKSKGDSLPESVAFLIEKNKILGTRISDSNVMVKGQFHNKLGKNNILKIKLTRPYQSNFNETIPINSDGYFSKEILIPKNGIYELILNGHSEDIYLQSQQVLAMIIDTSNRPRFIGSLASPNLYLKNKKINLLTFNLLGDSLYIGSAIDTKSKLDSIRSELEKNLSQFTNSDTTFSKFMTLERKNILYNYAYHMMNYDQQHLRFSGTQDTQRIDRSFLIETSFEDGKILELSTYQKFIFAYNNDFFKSISPTSTLYEQIDNRFNSLVSSITNKPIKEFIITDFLYEAIEKNPNKNMNPLIQKYRSDVSNVQYQESINRRYNSLIQVSEGSLAPQIIGTSLDGNEFKLSDLNGQFVYIFVWATWCGPCKVELPSYQKMVEELHHKNIVFLGISVDRSKEAWKNSLIYDEFPGLHVLVSGDWNSPLIKDYQIQTVPQFILINPKGEIIDLQAPRPTRNAYEYLDSLD